MKISIPISNTTDVLVIGGSTAAIQIATEAKNAGAEVFVITGYSYFGENICATMNFWDETVPMFCELFPQWPSSLPTPLNIKQTLERKLINAGISFLFETHAVKLMHDNSGRPAGIMVANRSGVQIISAKVVIDATERSVAARMTAMPFKAFQPGLKRVERVVMAAEKATLPGKLMPIPFVIGETLVYAGKFTAELFMSGATAADVAAIEQQMRHLSWHPANTGAADKCSFAMDDNPTGIDPAGFVFTPSQISGIAAAGIAAESPSGKPCRLKGESTITPANEIFSCNHSFRFADCEQCHLDVNAWPELGSYDVVVVGGGTAGAAAGISAARNGAKTLILEKNAHLGGVGTEGRIADYWFGNRIGFTQEVDNHVAAMGGPDYPWTLPNKWNVEWKQQYWHNEAVTAGCEVWFEQLVTAVGCDDDKVRYVIAAGPCGVGMIRAKVFIDATGNADVVIAAGGKTIYAAPEEPALQGTGLPPSIPGVSSYNSDYTFSVDSDVIDMTRTFVTARDLFADKFDSGRMVDTRERRRIVGDLTLMPMDFYLKRNYYDTINIAYSNFDTHGFTVHPLFMFRSPHKEPLYVKVPFRTMLPQGLANVIVVGLAISAHRDALPVVRMQADVQNQGYAAGIAAAMAASANIAMRQIDIRKLQQKLVDTKILPPEELTAVDGIPETQSDPVAAAFADPSAMLPDLRADFRQEPTLEKAMLLGFLEDKTGHDVLLEHLKNSSWDDGWHYTGMHQFGASQSKLDSVIMALNKIAQPTDAKVIVRLLAELTPSHTFSHYRSCALFLSANPCHDAVATLEKLLNQPGISGHAVTTQKQLINIGLNDNIDTRERNSLLKEFYLAMALIKCNPDNQLATRILKSYATGLHGLFAIYAAGSLSGC